MSLSADWEQPYRYSEKIYQMQHGTFLQTTSSLFSLEIFSVSAWSLRCENAWKTDLASTGSSRIGTTSCFICLHLDGFPNLDRAFYPTFRVPTEPLVPTSLLRIWISCTVLPWRIAPHTHCCLSCLPLILFWVTILCLYPALRFSTPPWTCI